MELSPVVRRSVPDEVADQLRDRILSGEIPTGQSLPGERELATTLGVSRPTVRAALAQLAASGLIATRQGGGTTVLDFRLHAGLDLLPGLLFAGGGLDLDVLADVVRLRSILGPQVARLAAERQDAEQDDVHLAMTALSQAADPVNAQLAALALWDAIVDLAGSTVFRLLFNGLRGAYEPAIESMAQVLASEVAEVDRYRELIGAIEAGDVDRAEGVATEILSIGQIAMNALIANLTPTASS